MKTTIYAFIFLYFLSQNTIFHLPDINNHVSEESIYWSTHVVPVCWEKTTGNFYKEKRIVEDAIHNSWEGACDIKFTCWCDCESNFDGVRIRIKDSQPVAKFLGKRLAAQPSGLVLNLSLINWLPQFPYYDRPSNSIQYEKHDLNSSEKNSIIEKIAIHEFGHVLGFAHQQSREDCDFYDCNFKDDAPQGASWTTQCDRYSVMNYCNPFFYNNGNLSSYDRITSEKIYGKSQLTKKKYLFYNSLAIEYQYIGKINGKNIPIPNINIEENRHILVKKKRQFTPPSLTKKYSKHKVIIYLKGSPKILYNIEKVLYTLHPTFEDMEVETSVFENRFAIELTDVWDHFQIKATAFFKNGSSTELDDLDLIPKPTNSTPNSIGNIFAPRNRGKDSRRN